MNFLIAGCHCCHPERFAFHVFYGQSASGDISDNDRHDGFGNWHQMTDGVSPSRNGCKSFTIDDTAYTSCGSDGGNLDDNDGYTYPGDSWASKTDCSAASSHLLTGTVGSYGYAVMQSGGATYQYDAGGDSWATKATRNSPATRNFASAFVADNGLFSATGTSSGSSNENSKYDPSGDSWSSKASHPVTKQQACGMGIGGKGYVFAGYSTSFPVTSELDQLDEYDPSGDAWTAKATDADGTANMMACGFPEYGYVTGGMVTDGGNTWYQKTNRYTPASDDWINMVDMPSPARRLSGCSNL